MADDAQAWSGRASLDSQYRTEDNLAARQSIYAYQRPVVDLAREIVSLLGPCGDETVADIGCGNGKYLAEFLGPGRVRRVLGVDLSPGMLSAVRRRLPAASLVVGDAASLPLRDACCDVALAMHMLYHVAQPVCAVWELRRVTRLGGRVLIMFNGEGHLLELLSALSAVLRGRGEGLAVHESLRLDAGEALARQVFSSVARHEFVGELLLPDGRPVEDYLRSMVIAEQVADYESVVAEVVRGLRFGADGLLRVRTATGVLVCS